jgi:hypothetical protein
VFLSYEAMKPFLRTGYGIGDCRKLANWDYRQKMEIRVLADLYTLGS